MNNKKKISADTYAFMRELIRESLRDWFKKEKWVRISTSGNIAGPCGTSKNKKNPDRCLPAAKARSLTKAQRAATAQKKRKAGKKGKTVVKNTKKATVQKEVRVYGDTKISDMLEKLARSIGREKFAMHILYDLPKDIKRDILNALDFKKGGIYNMDTLYLDAPMENLDPSYKHDGKSAPYGSGYRPAKKITKEDITNLVVGILQERKPISEKKKKKDDRCTRIAKRKYDTWPSAYASGAVVRCRRGEIWKGVK